MKTQTFAPGRGGVIGRVLLEGKSVQIPDVLADPEYTLRGATAEASVGAGLGANVLVGGSQRSVALQPLSLQGQTGVNVAAGIGELELHPAR